MAETQTPQEAHSVAPAAPAGRDDVDAHALPGWVNFIQDNLFLSFLILAEAYLLGTLMTLGWVANIEAPSQWGTYHGVGVVLFFLAGAMAAGVALRCSVKAAACFTRHEWGMALFNFTGLLLFSGSEIWASLSERSANLRPTPADTSVLGLLGMGHAAVSPTVVVVSLLLPFASLYYGFSQQHTRDTAQDRAAKAAQEDYVLERRQRRAEAQARLRAAQVAGLAGVLRAGVGAMQASPAPAVVDADDDADATNDDASEDGDETEGGTVADASPLAAPLPMRWPRPLRGQQPSSGS